MTDEPLITNPDPTTTASAEELRRLPRRARLAMVERIRIVYPRWQHLVREIRSCHEMAEIAAEPPCLLLVGPAGAGKTTLAQWYVNQYARTITPTHTIIPTLYVVIPSKATERNLSMAILHALGDPRYDKGTIGNMQIRVVNYMRDCRVQLLVLDELQHFVDRNSQKVLQDVSNWLKTVIKDQALHIGCVLIGLEDEAEQVVHANPQLARLFGDPQRLAPFTWDEAVPTTIKEFRTLLTELEKRLPLAEPSHLHHRERAWRCFVASGGIISYLMKLLRRATYDALAQGRECLDDGLLAEAFAQALAGERRGIPNPFLDAAPVALPPPTPEPATNRRSGTRTPGQPGTGKPHA